MKVLLIDNDVLIRLFVLDYPANKKAISKVISNLQLEYSSIWIPKEVKEEFLCKRNDLGRKKRINKIMERFPFIIDCPIQVSKNELRLINGNNDEDNGEADAILQFRKASSSNKFAFTEMHFLTNDNGAIERATNFGITVLTYQTLRETHLERGITLPK